MPKTTYNYAATEQLRELINKHHEINEKLEKDIRQLLKDGANPTVRDDFANNSLLMIAILNNRHELAKDLIAEFKKEAPEALDYRDTLPKAGNTALMLAIKKGFYQEAMMLLEAGANPNIVSDTDGFTPLHIACGLFGTSARIFSNTFFKGPTPSHLTAPEDDLIEVIKLLIKCGANLNATTTWGTKPLDLLSKEFSDVDLLFYKERESPLGIFLGYSPELVKEYEQSYLQNYPYEYWDYPKPSDSSVSKEFQQIHQDYLQYAAYRRDLSGKVGEESAQVEANMSNKRLVEFNNRQRPLPLSVQNILDRAKTDPRYRHLTSIDAINAECLKPDGLFTRPIAGLDVGHASGMNDLLSLIASTSWHRDRNNFSQDNFLMRRNMFLRTGFAKSTIDGLKKLSMVYPMRGGYNF